MPSVVLPAGWSTTWMVDRAKGSCGMPTTFTRSHTTGHFSCGVTWNPSCAITSQKHSLQCRVISVLYVQSLPPWSGVLLEKPTVTQEIPDILWNLSVHYFNWSQPDAMHSVPAVIVVWCLDSHTLLAPNLAVLLRGGGLLGEWRALQGTPAAVDLNWAIGCCLACTCQSPHHLSLPIPLLFVAVRWSVREIRGVVLGTSKHTVRVHTVRGGASWVRVGWR